MNFKEEMREQLKEALSDTNRYFFWEKYHRNPIDDSELIIYYIENGGGKSFRERQQKDGVK